MATRSTIAIVRKDNSVTSVYCQNDGYLNGVGLDLIKYWNTEEEVEELVKYGDMSTLGVYPDYYFDDNSNPLHYKDYDEFENDVYNHQSYVYVFKNGEWFEISNFDNPFGLNVNKYFAEVVD